MVESLGCDEEIVNWEVEEDGFDDLGDRENWMLCGLFHLLNFLP
jgi:hypothetical protein